MKFPGAFFCFSKSPCKVGILTVLEKILQLAEFSVGNSFLKKFTFKNCLGKKMTLH